MLALSEARKLTGRNKKGKPGNEILSSQSGAFLDPNSFIGIVNYLLILDMIGTIFEKKHPSENGDNKVPIVKALKMFSNIKDDDIIYAIVALRNSLAHNYGLANVPGNKRNVNQFHLFTLNGEENAPLILFPTEKWDGNFDSKSKKYTEIGIIKLIDEIEIVYSNLVADFDANLVTLAITDFNELNARFTVLV